MTASGGKKTKSDASTSGRAQQTAATDGSVESVSRPARAATANQGARSPSSKGRGGANKKSGGANKKSGGANKKSSGANKKNTGANKKNTGANQEVDGSEAEEEEVVDDRPFWEGIVEAAYRSRRARGEWPKD